MTDRSINLPAEVPGHEFRLEQVETHEAGVVAAILTCSCGRLSITVSMRQRAMARQAGVILEQEAADHLRRAVRA